MVARAWTASYDPALAVRTGEQVTPGRTDPDNPGWLWVTNAAGSGGWVPEQIVIDGKVVDNFDTAELTVSAGETIAVLHHRLGWYLCRNSAGKTGWLPAACFDAKPQID